MHVESISLLPPFFPLSFSFSLSLSSLSSFLVLHVLSTFFLAHLDNRRPWERKTSHPDNEDPSYPVQIFSSTAVCTGTNGPERSDHWMHRRRTCIYTWVFARRNLERANVVVDSVAAILHLTYLHRIDNEFMRDHPGENFIPGEMQT